MKVRLEVKGVEQKKYRKGPNVDQPYTTIAGLDTESDPWLKQVLEVRADPARNDIKSGDYVNVGVTSISIYNGIVQLDGNIDIDGVAKK